MRYSFDFIKFQGCGNDFILKDETAGPRIPDPHRSKMAMFLCDRHFWIGADGILFVEEANGADGSMRLFEPAGNEADMCGNGLRCVGAFLMGKLGKTEVDVLTRDGIKRVTRVGDQYRADMGFVRALREDLANYLSDRGSPESSMIEFPLELSGKKISASFVNTGEPHIVIVAENLDSVDVAAIGEEVNKDVRRFPKNVNVDFVQVTGPHDISVRTYERGVFDETLACGTGATACACVCLLRNLVRPGIVNVQTRGGVLRVEMASDGRTHMTGPALPVFQGRLVVEV
ncbi:MAG: diaminopimelate epimerase [Thermoplasmata archaeon]